MQDGEPLPISLRASIADYTNDRPSLEAIRAQMLTYPQAWADW